MAKRIYPNDPCPCGSGKKYKNCCGAPVKPQEHKRTNQVLEEFVLENIDTDLVLITNLMQVLLGPGGYEYCRSHAEELDAQYKKDGLVRFARKDELKLLELKQDGQSFASLRPYGGGALDKIEDILSLDKDGRICKEGHQVELFHAYLMQNIMRRFESYLYLPGEEVIKRGLPFGPFAHRGYDFLIGITLYIELQLGVHIYLGTDNPRNLPGLEAFIREIYIIPKELPLKKGMSLFLMDYMHAISDGVYKYSLESDIDLYNSIGAYSSNLYEEYKKMCRPNAFSKPGECNYVQYLIRLVAATCFNHSGLYAAATFSFPQSDFIRYIRGIELVVELFEDKSAKAIDPTKWPVSAELREIANEEGINLNISPYTLSIKEQYHEAVFCLLDELNGMVYHFLPSDIEYVDFAQINDDDFTLNDGKRNINPARKTTQVHKVRRLKMELYEFLNGKSFYFYYGTPPNVCCIGKYPVLPWVSSGKEDTNHIDGNQRDKYNAEDLYSEDLETRQRFLSMEYRLTEIPVNCILEFLNPDVFFNWREKHDLLKQVQKQNELLELKNSQLSRHIQLNQELIRNLSHSSSNYLNSDILLQTGKSLRIAEDGNPSLDVLHSNGLSLIFQSEQEEHLLRQLNSLVWRCSADSTYLTEQIRKGLSPDGGSPICKPVSFALRTLLSRVLFRENDIRSQFIRDKLGILGERWLALRSEFILDVLANSVSDEGIVTTWWNDNICKLNVSFSDAWEKLHIIEDGSFFDLITEIVTEQLFNALSHGELHQAINLDFGQTEEFRGRPKWAFVSCENTIGESYMNGRQVGVSTLNESISLINTGKRGVEVDASDNTYCSKVWLLSSLLKYL